MIGNGSLSMFARLLDRSVERIAEIAADPRRFDRGEIIHISDVWDNNTTTFFSAALAPTRWGRERRARAGLLWMADLGDERRDWMIAELGPVLGPASPRGPYHRDVRGNVYALGLPFGETELDVDYDLAGGVVQTCRVE